MFTVNNFSSVDVANESYVPDEQLCVNLVFMTGETYEIKTNLQNARLFEFSRAIKSHLDGITPIITFKYLNYDTGMKLITISKFLPLKITMVSSAGSFSMYLLITRKTILNN